MVWYLYFRSSKIFFKQKLHNRMSLYHSHGNSSALSNSQSVCFPWLTTSWSFSLLYLSVYSWFFPSKPLQWNLVRFLFHVLFYHYILLLKQGEPQWQKEATNRDLLPLTEPPVKEHCSGDQGIVSILYLLKAIRPILLGALRYCFSSLWFNQFPHLMICHPLSWRSAAI